MTAFILAMGLATFLESEWTAEELDAAFLQNAQQARTLHVEWLVVDRKTKSEWEYGRLAAEYWTRELAAGRIPEGKSPAQFEKYKAALAHHLAIPEPTPQSLTLISFEDYWTDRTRFQWRFPHRRPDSLTPRIVFTDEFTTSQTLPISFKHFSVMSGGLDEGRWRVWLGGGQNSSQGRIAVENPRKWDPLFPPLALPAPDWGPGVHWIDFFFRRDPNAVRYEGAMELNGLAVQVVSKVFPGRNHFGWKGATAIRAFLDSARSAIPVRLEVYYRTDEADADLTWLPPRTVNDFGHLPFPSLIVRDVKIERVGGKCDYPVSGFIDHPGSKPGTHLMQKPPVNIVTATTEWTAFKVEINRDIPVEMFNFDFPPNTPFANEPTGGDVWVSNADGLAERVSAGWARPSTLQKGFGYLWWIAGLVVVLGAVGIGLIKLRRSRMG